MREFFDLNESTLRRVIHHYGREYGHGPQKYFESTFQKWRNGDVQPRSETQDRILHCVPKSLSQAKQFTILSFYLPEYMRQLRSATRVHNLAIDAVPRAFADAAKRCRETEPILDWFVGGVFSEEELGAFANVARYTVLDCLHRAYAAVRIDLSAALGHLGEVDAKIMMCYHVEELGGVTNLDGVVPALPETAFRLPPVPDLIVRNRTQYEQQLLNHHCEMLVEQEAQISRHAVAKLDLSILQTAIASISKEESMESSFQVRGAGGRFKGTVCRKNLNGLKAQLFGRMTVAVLCTIGLVAGIAAGFASKDMGGLAPCGILVLLGLISPLWSWVFEKQKEVREYEQGRWTRSAEG